MMRFEFIFALLCFTSAVSANMAKFNTKNSVVCSGIYSKQDWGGSLKTGIDLKLVQYGDHKLTSGNSTEVDENTCDVAYVIFEYRDIGDIGYQLDNGQVDYLCTTNAIARGYCKEEDKGLFIVDSSKNSTVKSSRLTSLGLANIDYPIERTGYYCILTYGSSDYKGFVNFQNAFGHLSGSEIPKLPAYGILTLLYVVALALFGFQFFKKSKVNQILPLQKYLIAMMGFLTFDTLVVWSYYDLVNRTKSPSSAFVIFYLVFLALLNSIKITFSLFILLSVALGYGVVVLKLEKKVMLRCKILAGCQFLTSFTYLFITYRFDSTTVGTVDLDAPTSSFLILIPFLAVAVTSGIYYISISISIAKTIKKLNEQRQIIKLQLYQNLFRLVAASMILMVGGSVFSSFIYLSMSTTEMFERHWKSAFFIYDFWPSVVFFGTFIAIAWLWRPTETSYMLAISQQLSTEENDDDSGVPGYHQGHEFELDDLSLMSHTDEENQPGNHDSFELATEVPSTKNTANPPGYDEVQEHKQSTEQLHADGGSTLFELGEEDDSEEDKADDRFVH